LEEILSVRQREGVAQDQQPVMTGMEIAWGVVGWRKFGAGWELP